MQLSTIFINKEFTKFIVSKVLFTAGIKMVPVLLGWYLYELTGSKLALGMLGLSEVIPAILMALPAGVKVDSSRKRTLIIKCILSYIFIIAGLSLLTSDYLASNDNVQVKVYAVYLMIGLTGIIRAYISPSYSAFLAQLVSAHELVKAASIHSMSWLVAAIIGPTIAGLMIGFFAMSISFVFIIMLMILAIVLMVGITEKELIYDKGKTRTWQSVLEGVRFVRNQEALFGSMSLDMFAVLFGGAVAMLPVFAKDILHVGPQAFGLLMSATYLGNFLAILYLTKYPLQKQQGYSLLYSVAGFGLCIIIFALSTSFWLSFGALLISGIFDGVSVIIRGTIFQLLVPDHMRGRVSSVSSIFINSSNELGQFESGVAASLLGTSPSVVFGGCMTLLITAIAWFKLPALKNLEY